MKVHLVRHGQSDWNVARRVQGQRAEPMLTPLGGQQAHAAGQALSSFSVTALLSSDLPRAWETARILASDLGLEAVPEPALREQSLGRLEGMSQADALAATDGFDWTDPDAAVPGGESLAAVGRRQRELVAAIRTGAYGSEPVLVSHGDAIRVLSTLLADRPLTEIPYPSPPNGSITTLTLADLCGTG